MSYITVFPLPLFIPVTATGIGIVIVTLPIPQISVQMELRSISASLQALTTGPFTVEVRQGVGTLVDTVTFNAAGTIDHNDVDARFDSRFNVLRFDVTAIGTGAQNCYVTPWFSAEM